MAELSRAFIDRLMTIRYGTSFDDQGKPDLKPQEMWAYGEKRKGIIAELSHMPAVALAHLQSETFATALPSSQADRPYDPYAFAK